MITFTLTSRQMLHKWKLALLIDPPQPLGTVTRSHGLDMDATIEQQMRARYIDLLRTSPADILPLVDIADSVTLSRAPDGAGIVALPPQCLRVVSVMAQGWHRPALIVSDPASPEAIAQHSPFARGGSVSPVAVIHGHTLRLYTPPTDASIASLTAVILPERDTYTLTPPLLSLMLDSPEKHIFTP